MQRTLTLGEVPGGYEWLLVLVDVGLIHLVRHQHDLIVDCKLDEVLEVGFCEALPCWVTRVDERKPPHPLACCSLQVHAMPFNSSPFNLRWRCVALLFVM